MIAITEKDIVMGDTATVKKEAIQLAYLCCVQLKNPRKQKVYGYQLSEIGLAVPVLEQTAREV